MLADTSELLLRRYKGDLRNLREEAGRDPDRERELLQDFKGIGDVGSAIFCREAQLAWDELYPFADDRVLAAAGRVELGNDARALARLVDRDDLPRLTAALVRAELDGDWDGVRERASGG